MAGDKLYLKSSCPFCLKVVVALSELGALDKVDMLPDSEENRKMLEEKAGKSPSFPALEPAEGDLRMESDDIIQKYCEVQGKKMEDLQGLAYYKSGLMKNYMMLIKHVGGGAKAREIFAAASQPK